MNFGQVQRRGHTIFLSPAFHSVFSPNSKDTWKNCGLGNKPEYVNLILENCRMNVKEKNGILLSSKGVPTQKCTLEDADVHYFRK